MEFLALVLIVAAFYFGFFLPVFQYVSRRKRGRKFTIRLGIPWDFRNPEHRWDVLMSFLSFMFAMAAGIFVFDYFFAAPTN